MRVGGAFGTPRSRADVYAFVADPRRLAQELPNIDKAEASDDAFTVIANAGIGPLSGSIQVHMRRVGQQPNRHVSYRGQGRGLGSTLELSAEFDFADHPEGGTAVTWSGDAGIDGPLGPVAGAALQPIAQHSIGDFAAAM